MARPKRKRTANVANGSNTKRAKVQHPHGTFDPDREYKLKSIVGETATKYYISWEDDEETGEVFENTWEPKKNANQEAIDHWNQLKAEKKRLERLSGRLSETRSTSDSSTQLLPRVRKGNRRIIESSPLPAEAGAQESLADDSIEIRESPEVSPLFEPQAGPSNSNAAVRLSSPPSSYLAGHYQLEPSQTASTGQSEPSQDVSDLAETPKRSGIPLALNSPLQEAGSAPVYLGPSSSNRVVPDSQSAPNVSTFRPSDKTARIVTSSAPEPVPARIVGLNGEDSSNSNNEPFERGTEHNEEAAVETPQEQTNTVASSADRLTDENHTTSAGAFPARQAVKPVEIREEPPSVTEGDESQSKTSQLGDARQQGEWSDPDSFQSKDTGSAESRLADVSVPIIDGNPGKEQHTDTPLGHPTGFGSHLNAGSETDQAHRSSAESGHSSRRNADQALHGSSVAPIDLTTTQDHPVPSSIPITSPAPRLLPAFGVNRALPPQPSDYSVGQDFFPFLTQISKRTSRNLASSSIPAAPSQSFSVGTFGESAPSPPRLPYSSPVRLSIGNTMDQVTPGSNSGSGSGRELLDNLRAMRQERKAARAAQRGETPSTATPTPHETPEGASHIISAQTDVLPQSSIAAQTTTPAQSLMPGQSSTSGATAASELKRSIPPRLNSPFLLAQDRAMRSPSAIPAMEPLPIITQHEMNTSRRCETLLPQSQMQEDASRQVQQNGSIPRDGSSSAVSAVDVETANVHILPIYFLGHQRDQYPQTIYFHKDLITRFLASNSADDELSAKAKQFVESLRKITIHPDLDNDETLTQYDVQPSRLAQWDVDCSAKFRFLRDLFEALRTQQLHVAILARPGRILDILETFLQGIDISYHRASAVDVAHQDTVEGGFKVSLASTGTHETPDQSPADLVVDLDNSAKHDSEQVRALRRKDGTWSPLVKLVVPRSVEHVERSLSPNLSNRTFTRALISGIQQFRNDAGKAEGQGQSKATARELADYLVHGGDAEWPIPTLANLDDLDSQTESEVTTSNTGASKLAIVGEKRSRDNEDIDASEPNKRSRVESPVEDSALQSSVHPQELDVMHISDSIEKATQSQNETEAASSPAFGSIEQRLKKLLSEAQDRLEEHVKVLSDLQYRHEEQRTRLLEVTKERNAAIDTAENAVSRFSEESNKTSKLRGENASLKEQLKETNDKLLEHSVPERAQFEAARLEAAQAKADKEKVDKRLEQANKDVAYVRDLYQTSSTSAQSLAAQVTELEDQLAVAQNRATGEQAKLRKIGHDTLTKNLQEENKKLKVMLKEREAGLKFRDEEIAKLKEASRGRMGTRGTSVPRSPRMGSPRVGSRQTSPATGELRGRSSLLHPLRNA